MKTEKLLMTLRMDKVYPDYKLYIYECKTQEGKKYFELSSNEFCAATIYETKTDLLLYINEWLTELNYKTIKL